MPKKLKRGQVWYILKKTRIICAQLAIQESEWGLKGVLKCSFSRIASRTQTSIFRTSHQFIGLFKVAAESEVLCFPEEGLDVAVVGLQDGVEVLERILVRALSQALNLSQKVSWSLDNSH